MQNPSVQQFNIGVQHELPGRVVLRVDGVHNLGTHFIIGRTVGEVFNPVVGGPDRVVNLESSVNTKCDALLVSAEGRMTRRIPCVVYAQQGLTTPNTTTRSSATRSTLRISGSVRPHERPAAPDDRGGRSARRRWHAWAPIWTIASGVPMDILLPAAQSRVPVFQRNAGGRLFKTAARPQPALTGLNEGGGVDGQLLPLVGSDARFNDAFNSVDLRVSRRLLPADPRGADRGGFQLVQRHQHSWRSNRNYSGFSNVLVRDSNDPREPGYLSSSRFGRAVTTAGGVFGSGGPRAFQFAVRATF